MQSQHVVLNPDVENADAKSEEERREQNFFVYSGEMEKGLRKGFGRLYSMAPSSNSLPPTLEAVANAKASDLKLIYEGFWSDDRPNGSGVAILNAGSYEGEWKAGVRHGKGQFTFTSRVNRGHKMYKGEWMDDVPHGLGEFGDEFGTTSGRSDFQDDFMMTT